MTKIAIIGGGISGLANLHYLKKRFGTDAQVRLYERNPHMGGNIQSASSDGFLFEYGPNGFLTNTPETLSFIDELGLSSQLIKANFGRRYILSNNRLEALPMDPIKFLTTPILTANGKWQIIRGLFKKNISKERSAFEYVSLRFGQEAAERLFDPFVSGVYAGDVKRLHMASCFGGKKQKGKTKLMSFKNGMGQLIRHLEERYKDDIQNNNEITSIDQIKADHIVLAVPAYVAARILNTDILEQIPYAPIAVVGLGFDAKAFAKKPDGFGCLIPSSAKKEVLGVLLESNVFANRAPEEQIMVRVMLGGRHHPEIINDDPDVLLDKALKELTMLLGLRSAPKTRWVKIWPKAIPQYELDYPSICDALKAKMLAYPHITLTGNYLGGISFNDCIRNAQTFAQSLKV